MECSHSWEEIGVKFDAYNPPYANGENAYASQCYILVRKCTMCNQVELQNTQYEDGWHTFEDMLENERNKKQAILDEIAYMQTEEYKLQAEKDREECSIVVNKLMNYIKDRS